MQIGSKPNEHVFIARQGGDTYLVVGFDERMLYLYQTVETLLCPGITVFEEYMDRPYFWSEDTGMMSVLAEVSKRSFAHVEDPQDAVDVLEDLEVSLGTL